MNKIVLYYYVYCIIIISIFSYAVFIEGHSGWWFLAAALLTDKSPTIKNKE